MDALTRVRFTLTTEFAFHSLAKPIRYKEPTTLVTFILINFRHINSNLLENERNRH